MFKDENRHYSLRKLSVGLASVLIGISFASSMNGNSVKADTVKSDSNGVAETKNATTSETNKVDANVDSSKEVAKSANSVDSNTITPSQTALNKQTTSNDLLKGTDVKQEQVVEPKVATTPKTINLSNDVIAIAPKETTWQVANNLEHDTYYVSNGKYTVELPHISNAQLHVIANDSTKDSVLFTYKGQNTKYVFNIKFANGHYLLATYEIKSDKLVKLIDYNFIKSSKMIDVIVDWLKR